MSTSTTTNYGWTIPNDDELVKNGAAAIRTLGQAIDTTAAASFAPALVKINTTSFSSVSSQQINDIFSSTYDNYKIYLNITSGSGGSLSAQFCAGGTPTTTANYNNVNWLFRSGNASAVDTANENSTTIAILAGLSSGEGIEFNLYNPFASQYTLMSGYVSDTGGAGFKSFVTVHGGNFLGTTSFDGIKFNFGTSHSGIIRVYGIRN